MDDFNINEKEIKQKICMNCKYFYDCIICEKGIQSACELFEYEKGNV